MAWCRLRCRVPSCQQRSRDGTADRQPQRSRQHPLPNRFVAPLPRIEVRPTLTRSRPTGRYWPTADDLEYRLVRVTKDEKTCLGCGETFGKGICPRCGLPEPGEKDGNKRMDRLPPAVATISYLRDEEYRGV